MDTYLAVASKRDERRYAERPLPVDVVERILDAGRLSGSGSNRQPWRFLLVESPERRERLAEAVYEPGNIRGAALVLAIVGKGFDLGRAAQNMMLTAWNEGVASCPNGIEDAAAVAEALDLEEGEVGIVLSLGYPARPRDPESRPAEEWSAQANRQPLGEFVTRR
ncbi:MAG: nitroreductase family protein [Gaiellaceae bacterium]